MRRGAEDITKLPKWAQMRIGKLERDIEYYKDQMHEMLAEHGESSGVSIVRFAGDRKKETNLPASSIIKFALTHGYTEVRTEELNGKPFLSVITQGGSLAVKPIVSNAIEVHILPRGN